VLPVLPPQPFLGQERDPHLLQSLFDGAAHNRERLTPVVFEILNGAKRNAHLLRKLPLRPIKQAARGAALWREIADLRCGMIGGVAGKRRFSSTAR
jgi:hypothetical protein